MKGVDYTAGALSIFDFLAVSESCDCRLIDQRRAQLKLEKNFVKFKKFPLLQYGTQKFSAFDQ